MREAEHAREVTCVWCGHQFESTLQSQADHLYEHAKVCEKHPLRRAEAEVERLRKTNDELIAENARLRGLIRGAP